MRSSKRRGWIAPRPLAGLVAVVAVVVGYLALLAYEEQRAAQRLESLRESDPAAYLETVRGRESFDAYMADYAELRGYDRWRETVPAFLAGRWALFAERQRSGVGFEPERRSPAVLFEDGAVHLLGADGRRFAAAYRIADGQVQLRLASGDIVAVQVDGLERRIQDIALTLPGLGLRYGYRCG